MFSNFSIKTRVSLAFGVLVVLLLVVAGFGQYGTKAGKDALHDTYAVQLSSAVAIGDTKYNLAIARVSMDRALLHPQSPDVAALIPKARDYVETARKAYARYLALPKTGDEQRLAEAMTRAFDALVTGGIEPTLQALQAGDATTADRITMTVMPNLSLALTKSTADLNAYLMGHGANEYAQFQSTLNAVSISSGVLFFLAVGISLACAVGLHRAISRPLASALNACASMAQGNLSKRIEVHGRDEMSELMRGLSAMQDGLKDTVSTVRTSSESMATATHQIASGNADLSRRTESQAAALQETAASMEELTATVRQNNESANNASHLASQAAQVAQTGGTMMERVVETMSGISEQSEKIASIIGTIEGIAFQTNILALNAAVEAARAGEQGRGFAVVATEVRTLAQRSATAAKEIKTLIDSAATSVTEGTGLVNSAGTTMSEIVTSIQKVNDIMTEVAAASKEQSDGIEQVNRAVSQMDEVTQQNAALVEQTTAAAVSLAEQAQVLRAAAVRFQT
ncbi:methyl-accepting chemotaxis protein-1 (serine sensor receptor) [Paraburkholderia sp. GAS199]|uniref:methyl-accepting chemotaxis protein n=1 Tax=Paraburkholderia sp. GAS199 TaxID=3035126 RepID=UPI003D236D5B